MVYLAGNHWHSFGCGGSVSSSKATLKGGLANLSAQLLGSKVAGVEVRITEVI